MTPHSANPHPTAAAPVILPRISAAQVADEFVAAASDATAPEAVRVVSTTGWSPSAWRLTRR